MGSLRLRFGMVAMFVGLAGGAFRVPAQPMTEEKVEPRPGDGAPAPDAAPTDTAESPSRNPDDMGAVRGAPPATRAAGTPRAENPPRRAPEGESSQSRNRLLYVATQAPLSIYVYGLSLPLALDYGNAKLAVATPLLVAPFAFGGHFWFAKNHEFRESHLRGTNYLSVASLYLSHAVPFALMDLNDKDDVADAFRVSSFIALGAYPLGLWGGYLLGDRYVDAPGRIQTQAHFASSFGLLGFFSPFLYYQKPDDHLGDIFHLGLGQSVAMAVAGHFLAGFSHEGENIPEGVTSGIVTHGALGAGAGLTVAAIADASTIRPWMGAALAGGTLGVMEGVLYFSNRYDTPERALFNLLGAGAGTLMGGGVLVLAYDDKASSHEKKVLFTSLFAGGALLGYAVTDVLTRGMEDRKAGVSGAAPKSWSDRLAVNLLPYLEPQLRDQQIYYRYRVPGFSLTF